MGRALLGRRPAARLRGHGRCRSLENPRLIPETLSAAVASFNQQAANDPVGATQPPLTEDEVLAAIRAWNPSPIQVPADPKGVRIVKEISDTTIGEGMSP